MGANLVPGRRSKSCYGKEKLELFVVEIKVYVLGTLWLISTFAENPYLPGEKQAQVRMKLKPNQN